MGERSSMAALCADDIARAMRDAQGVAMWERGAVLDARVLVAQARERLGMQAMGSRQSAGLYDSTSGEVRRS